MSFTRINAFEARDGAEGRLGEFLLSILPEIADAPGCLQCRLLRQEERPRMFLVIEEWASQADHAAAAARIPIARVQAIMPLLEMPPSGTWYSQIE